MPPSGKVKSRVNKVKSVWWDVRGIHQVEGRNMVGKVREEDGEGGGCPHDSSLFRKVSA